MKERRFVARDRTKQELNGRRLFVRSAADIESKEFLAILVSYQRSSFAALVFVNSVFLWVALSWDYGKYQV